MKFISFWGENVPKYWLTASRTKPAQEKGRYVMWLARPDLTNVYLAIKLQKK